MEDYLKTIQELQNKVLNLEQKLSDFRDSENKLRQTVDKLQGIESQLNESQRITKIGHYIYDIKSDNWSNSQELDRIFGIDEFFLRNAESWVRIIHPDYQKMMGDYLKINVIENHENFDKEYRIIDQKTGEIKWVHGFGNLKFNENGNPETMFGTIQDITEQKHTELNLKASEEKFKKIFLISPVPVNINRLDDGLYVSVNKGFTKTMGYTENEVAGKTSIELEIWENPEQRFEMVEDLKKDGIIENLEVKFKAKSGEIIDGLMSANTIELGGMPHIISITRDITDWKKAQNELQKSERRLNNLINNLQGIVYKCLLDHDWTMEFISSGFENITGYKCIDIIGNKKISFYDIIEPDDRERVFREITETLAVSSQYQVKFKIKTASGKILHVTDRGIAIKNEQGNILALEGFITDITKQVEADEALHESEIRFKDLVELLPEAVFEADLNLRFTYVNKRAFEITGYSEEDLYDGLIALDLVAPGDKARVIENFKKRLNGENVGTQKYNLIKKDGTEFHVFFHASSIIRNGQVIGLRGIIVDISDRIKAENALRESEQKLRLIINNSSFGITTTDLEGHLIDVNPAMCNFIGFSKDEMLGKHFNIYSHLDDREKNIKLFRNLVEGKIPFFELEKRYIHKKGNIIHVLIRSQLIHDHLGNPIFQTAMIEDITERKKAEQIQKVLYNISNAAVSTVDLENLIRLIREELATIIDTTNFYVALYDEETGNISLPFFTDEKDYYTYIPKGKSLTQYVIDTKKSLLANGELKKRLVEEGTLEHIGSISKIWLGVPLKTEGKVTGVLALHSYTNENAFNESDVKMLEFVSDQISVAIQRKKAETGLKTALAKANESDRLKSSFLATISHELRTPLNAIIGFSEFLDKQLPPEEVEKFGQIIHTSGLHLLSIVNDLFDLTLIETGKTKVIKEEIIPATILNDVSNVIFSNTKKNSKNFEIKLIAPENHQNHLIYTDANKLKQILTNLLKNASKFTNEGFIHYGYTLITENDKPYVHFFVKDSGIGISEDKQELIFDIFRQVDETSTRKYGGAGIGLSVAKRLTELLGGRIWLNSKPSQGSCFNFTIPVENRNGYGNFTVPVKNSIENLNQKVILIAEDDDASFTYLKTLLEKKGIIMLRAKNGEEAVEMCLSVKKIDLVLMDINMPGMNGYTATQKIKNVFPELPIIAQTAYAAVGDREKIFESGCDEYISKPVKAAELILKIEQLIGKN
jgi:PAS domain S-box-containing protein